MRYGSFVCEIELRQRRALWDSVILPYQWWFGTFSISRSALMNQATNPRLIQHWQNYFCLPFWRKTIFMGNYFFSKWEGPTSSNVYTLAFGLCINSTSFVKLSWDTVLLVWLFIDRLARLSTVCCFRLWCIMGILHSG